jgi:hypothetical protein
MPSRDESFTNIAGEQIERAQSTELRRGTVLAGRYQIETILGQGGAGLVFAGVRCWSPRHTARAAPS